MDLGISYIEWLGYALMMVAGFLILSSAIGVLRMPDFYTRLHPAGITDSLAAPILLIGCVLLSDVSFSSLKFILLILAIAITGPTATHMTAKMAFKKGLKPKEINQGKDI